MSSEYFMRHLTWREAEDFMEGLLRRYYSDWERTRMQVNVAARCAGSKRDVFGELPWEKRQREKELRASIPTEEEKEWFKDAAKLVESKAREKEKLKKN